MLHILKGESFGLIAMILGLTVRELWSWFVVSGQNGWWLFLQCSRCLFYVTFPCFEVGATASFRFFLKMFLGVFGATGSFWSIWKETDVEILSWGVILGTFEVKNCL